MIVDVINQSTLITTEQITEMVAAVDAQSVEFSAVWGTEAPMVQHVTTPSKPAPGMRAATIYVVDTIAAVPAGVLGYHTEARGEIRSGFVAVKPELDNGAQVLTGDWSVSSILSHEVLELLADPSCSFWANHGPHAVALEVCDPVEAPTYEVDGVSVSNFVTPAWFDPDGVRPFDQLGLLSHPFSILAGGYIVQATLGAENQVFGSAFPDWRRDMKRGDTSRTSRRLASLAPPIG